MAHDQAVDEVLDDLAEGQGDDGQIVAPEPQYGYAHDDARDARAYGAGHHSDGQPQRFKGDGLCQTHGSDDAGKSAHAHKSRMAQTQLTQNTHSEVQGHSHDHIAACRDQQTYLLAAQSSVVHQNGDDDECDDDAQIGGEIHLGAFFHVV